MPVEKFSRDWVCRNNSNIKALGNLATQTLCKDSPLPGKYITNNTLNQYWLFSGNSLDLNL